MLFSRRSAASCSITFMTGSKPSPVYRSTSRSRGPIRPLRPQARRFSTPARQSRPRPRHKSTNEFRSHRFGGGGRRRARLFYAHYINIHFDPAQRANAIRIRENFSRVKPVDSASEIKSRVRALINPHCRRVDSRAR